MDETELGITRRAKSQEISHDAPDHLTTGQKTLTAPKPRSLEGSLARSVGRWGVSMPDDHAIPRMLARAPPRERRRGGRACAGRGRSRALSLSELPPTPQTPGGSLAPGACSPLRAFGQVHPYCGQPARRGACRVRPTVVAPALGPAILPKYLSSELMLDSRDNLCGFALLRPQKLTR